MNLSRQFDLKGRSAVVTGSSSGIGKAIALGLAEFGADVLVHGASNRQRAETLADEIRALGRRAEVAIVDLGEADAARQVFDAATAAFGTTDILVSNASVQVRAGWASVTTEDFDRQMQINVRCALEMIQLFAPAMLERKWGRVLTLGSVQQYKPSEHMPVYAATKAAQMSLVRNLAKQFAGRGVTVNNLAPGVFETDRNLEALSDAAYRAKIAAMVPMGTFGEPIDCAGAALLLCSDAGRYITGTDIIVDGGMTL